MGGLGGVRGGGGGSLYVPLLVLVFGFAQHRAQGTTLIAMVPPTGLLAFINYARAHQVDWRVGLLLIPGVFLGGVLGARLALRLAPRPMRMLFAGLVFLLGALREYWKSGDVDLRAGMVCAAGALAGGYGGSVVALLLAARHLKAGLGVFLMISALLLLRQAPAKMLPRSIVQGGDGEKR